MESTSEIDALHKHASLYNEHAVSTASVLMYYICDTCIDTAYNFVPPKLILKRQIATNGHVTTGSVEPVTPVHVTCAECGFTLPMARVYALNKK